MDPINQVDFSKDSTVAIIEKLQNKAKIKLIIPDSIEYDSKNIYRKIAKETTLINWIVFFLEKILQLMENISLFYKC